MNLIGTWEMTSFVTTFDDGTTQLSYGPNAAGRICYGADGFMSAHLWDPDRHRPGLPVTGDAPYFSYCGTWRVEGDTVHHAVIASSRPAWAGTTVTRRIVPAGDEVELIADVTFSGKSGQAVIRWRRI